MQNQKHKCQKTGFHYACLYIDILSIKTMRPTEKLLYIITHHKIPVQVMSLAKLSVKCQVAEESS